MLAKTELKSAQRQGGDVAALKRLAQEGESWHASVAKEVQQHVASITEKITLFRKCIPIAAQWAGFVEASADWRNDAARYLISQTHFVKMRYRPGYHGGADPIAYLDSWVAVLDLVGSEPSIGCTSAQILRFQQDCFAALMQLEWRRDRHWLGPWTFHAVFKILLLHERRLWSDTTTDAIEMPTGGESNGYSFERGWDELHSLGLVQTLPASTDFADGMRRSAQAHAQVTALAARAGSRSLHVNSAIYLLGAQP